MATVFYMLTVKIHDELIVFTVCNGMTFSVLVLSCHCSIIVLFLLEFTVWFTVRDNSSNLRT